MSEKKKKRFYQCQKCGYESAAWLGRCPDCGEWNSLVEERPTLPAEVQRKGPVAPKRLEGNSDAVYIGEVAPESHVRYDSGLKEFDRILGGGTVKGSVVLIGGDPGIGKSTLLLQVMSRFGAAGHRVLYTSGEESLSQIKLRSERLQVPGNAVIVMAENELEKIFSAMEEIKPQFLVIDSIQTLFSSELSSPPGSVSQIRDTSNALIQYVKDRGISLFFIGHVTKEGSIAGPKLLEHMVDAVLYFEGDNTLHYRVLSVVKNRFGASHEVGLFEMKSDGLHDVKNTSEFLIAESNAGKEPGSSVAAVMGGTRPILIETQALVVPTRFGSPRRTTIGFDPNRAAMLCAVLEKQMGWAFSEHDLFVKVLGGMTFADPGLDLAVVTAMASSYLEKPLPPKTVFWGEVGLSGEIRAVQFSELRFREAVKIGYSNAIGPPKRKGTDEISADGDFQPFRSVRESLAALFPK